MAYYCLTLRGSVVYWIPEAGSAICQDKVHTGFFLRRQSERLFREALENIRHLTMKSCGPRSSSLLPKGLRIRRSAGGLSCPVRLSLNGGSVSLRSAWPVFGIKKDAVVPAYFPPEVVMEVKALACELPKDRGIPLSRFSQRDIAREVIGQGIVGSISGITVWRWLSADAIRPWSYRSWISIRDPDFSNRAGRVIDLYHRNF